MFWRENRYHLVTVFFIPLHFIKNLNIKNMGERFTKEDLIAFGNYMLSEERKESMKANRKSVPLLKDRLKEVNDCDFQNFLESRKVQSV